MRELELLEEKLKFQEKYAEKELVDSSANILDNLTHKLKDIVFDFGIDLAMQIISSFRKSKSTQSSANP